MSRAIPAALLAAALAACSGVGSRPMALDQIKLPPGFHISLYAEGVPSARQMAIGPNGTVFAGSMDAGNVYAIVDGDRNNQADEVIRIATGLHMPSGVAVRDGALYVAEVSQVWRYDDIEAHLHDPPEPAKVGAPFPDEDHHGWKFIAFGPDGMLYVPVGAPCNICRPDERHGGIFRMNPDGSGLQAFASGIRNSVGFDWDPETRELWFTDNGRDGLGDDIPPDELNHAARQGLNFGYPDCHAGTIQDPEIGHEPCGRFTPPAFKLTPHGASIGMRFYTGAMFPDEYRNQVFVAEHGSWNRSVPTGYRVMRVRMEGNRAVGYEPFAEGWLQGDRPWGRPADVLVMPDGALLVSDDAQGAIYRIAYSK